MKAKHYAALLTLLLAGSFYRWTDEEKEIETEGDIVVFRGDVSEIETIRYHDEKADALIELRGTGEDAYPWVKVDARKVVKPKPEPSTDPANDTPPQSDDVVASDSTSEDAATDAAANDAAQEEVVEVTTTEFKGRFQEIKGRRDLKTWNKTPWGRRLGCSGPREATGTEQENAPRGRKGKS